MATWVRQNTTRVDAPVDSDLDPTLTLDNATAPGDFDPAGVTQVDFSITIRIQNRVDDTWIHRDAAELFDLVNGGNQLASYNDNGTTEITAASDTQSGSDTTPVTTATTAQWQSAQVRGQGPTSGELAAYVQQMKADGGNLYVLAGDVTVTITYTPAASIVSLAGAGAAASDGTGTLSPTRGLTGAGPAVSDGTGALDVSRGLAGAGAAASSGSGSLTVTRALSGSGASSSDGSGDLTVTAAAVQLAGTGSAASSGFGSLRTVKALTGTGSAASQGSGDLSLTRGLTGTGSAAASMTGPGSLFTDDFNRANEALDASADWTKEAGSGLINIVSNQLDKGGTESSPARYYYEPDLGTPNHYAELEVLAGVLIGPTVRSATGADTFYHARMASGGTVQLYRFVEGQTTTLLDTAASAGSPATIRLEVNGTGSQVDLVVKRNGTTLITYADTDALRITSGTHAGIRGFDNSGLADNFEAGALAPVGLFLSVTRGIAGSGANASDGVGTLTVAGAIDLAGAGAAASSGTGSLGVRRPLTGSGAAASDGAGSVHVTRGITGSGAAASDGAGSLTATVALSGAGPNASDGSGDLTIVGAATQLSGSGAAASAGTGSLSVTAALAGSGAAASDGTGSLDVTRGLAGAGASASDGSGDLTVTAAATQLAGSGAAASAGTGSLSITVGLSGAGASVSDGVATLALTVSLAGSGNAASSGDGVLTVQSGAGWWVPDPVDAARAPLASTRSPVAASRVRQTDNPPW